MDKSRKSPDTRERPQRRGFRGTAENAKTKICLRHVIKNRDPMWQNGDCRFGDRCNFAHGDTELRNLPPREDTSPVAAGRGRGGRGRGFEGGFSEFSGGRGSGRGPAGRGTTPGAKPVGNGGDHAAWVASGCPVRGPNGWTQYQTETGEKYYHNSNTNDTQWDTPSDWKGPL